jgi:hypothetical protein
MTVSELNGRPSKRLKGADVGIPPRQLDFRLSEEMPRWIYADNRTATTYLTVLSAFFPPGEDFFVRSVRAFADQVTDPVLKAQVNGFIAQEVIHGREHDRLNEVLRERGFNLDVAQKALAVALGVLELLPARQQLACTAFMEHFTAVMAEETLRTDEMGRTQISEDLKDLWLWHALEELEHKAVSYDVLEVAGNSRVERLLAIPAVATTVLPAMIVSWAYLLVTEGALTRPKDVARGLKLMFAPGEILPAVARKLPFFGRRGFHPAKHDTREMEQRWREALFGPDGTLREQLRRTS